MHITNLEVRIVLDMSTDVLCILNWYNRKRSTVLSESTVQYHDFIHSGQEQQFATLTLTKTLYMSDKFKNMHYSLKIALKINVLICQLMNCWTYSLMSLGLTILWFWYPSIHVPVVRFFSQSSCLHEPG